MSKFIARLARLGRSRLMVSLAAFVLVGALSASATYAVGNGTRLLRSRAPSLASVLRPLTPSQRRYVLGIMSLTPIQVWAAFGTSLTPPRTTSPPVAVPIVPACLRGVCWRATTRAGVHKA